jgi:hypothetical protein
MFRRVQVTVVSFSQRRAWLGSADAPNAKVATYNALRDVLWRGINDRT